tara:strand:- start:41 stop:235 length:195 start_codon:yes stop_codon:yes gene_type:complete
MIETYKRYDIIYHENDDDIIGLATDLKILYNDDGIVNEVQDKLNELKENYKEQYLKVNTTYVFD